MSLGGSNRLLDVQHAAELLDIENPRTLRNNWRAWGLPAFKVGRELRFRERDLWAWLEKQKVQSVQIIQPRKLPDHFGVSRRPITAREAANVRRLWREVPKLSNGKPWTIETREWRDYALELRRLHADGVTCLDLANVVERTEVTIKKAIKEVRRFC